jgi:hypothetical protein
MPASFSISRLEHGDGSPDAMQQEIQARTLDEAATRSILRSIERFGQDESIRYYEVVQQASFRTRNGGAQAAWTVRAVR